MDFKRRGFAWAAMARFWIVGALVAMALGTAGRAEATTITLESAESAQWLNQFGTPLGDEAALLNIMQAAADTWSSVLQDPSRLLHIEFGFSDMLPAGVGGLDERVNPSDPTSALIAFDSHTDWFIDPTPLDNSEYTSESLTSDDLGGGVINTGHQYLGGTGAAAGKFDLYSTVLHEMGHSLGLDYEYGVAHEDDPIVVTAPRPAAGSVIPQSYGHLQLSTAVMAPYASYDTRTLLSDADILAIAEAGNYSDVRLNDFDQFPEPVPEPPAFLLLLGGGGFLLAWRRLRGGAWTVQVGQR